MLTEIRKLGNRADVLDAARITVNKDACGDTPTKEWWSKILMAEHSPIRLMTFWAVWRLPKWVSTHFVRHKIGVEHFVSTSRPDRTGVPREEKEQLVTHSMILNAQAIINISRKRMCQLASPETRDEWDDFLENLRDDDPVLWAKCVPECVYRGFCPEMKTCGYYATSYAERLRQSYLNGYEDRVINVSKL